MFSFRYILLTTHCPELVKALSDCSRSHLTDFTRIPVPLIMRSFKPSTPTYQMVDTDITPHIIFL